jgi:endoglucanase
VALPRALLKATRTASVASYLAAVFSLIAIIANSGCGSDAMSPRHAVQVDGNQLADGEGSPIRLIGVNRSGSEYACLTEGLGVFDGPIGKRAIAAMKTWRINAVRVPLNEDCWLGINGAPAKYSAARYHEAVKKYVIRLHEAGLYVVLDLHWSAPGAKRATGQQPMADLDHAPDFWSSVARTFKDDPALVFDLYNEPYDVSWQCWRDGCLMPEGWRTAGMQTLVDAVRSAGASQPVIASGLASGSDLSGWLEYRPRDPAHQLAAGLHMYDFSAPCDEPDCWATDVGTVARQVPVVTTELGQDTCPGPFIDRFTSWADRAGLSYLGWTWNPTGCDAPALIKSWDGLPTASGARFRAHLLGL